MRILIIAPTHPNLPDVAREAAAVSNAHPGSRLLQGKVVERDLADAVATCSFDMLWLASHGSPAGVQLSDGVITGEALTAYVAASGASLVFLNTCSSIMLAQLLVDGTPASVVATIQDLPDHVAMRTGLLFANQLAAGSDPRQAYEKSKPGQNHTYIFLQNASPPQGGKKGWDTPTAAPGRKKRGAQAKNTNALKHGFYSRNFQELETKDLDAMLLEGIDDEIYMLRVATRRVMDLATSADDLMTATTTLDTLGAAATRLAGLLKTKRLLSPSAGNDVARSIGEALAAVVKEMQLS